MPMEEVIQGTPVPESNQIQMVTIDPQTLQAMASAIADAVAVRVVQQMVNSGAIVPTTQRPVMPQLGQQVQQGATYLLHQGQGVVGNTLGNVNYVGQQVISGVEGIALTLTNIARGLVGLVTLQGTPPTQIR